MKRVIGIVAVISIATAPSLGAQLSRRIEVGAAFGVSALPAAVADRCGFGGGGDGGTEIGGAAVLRFGHGLVAQADMRRISAMNMFGCKPIALAPGATYVESNVRNDITTSTARLGIETPRSWPLFRVTAGGGLVWGTPKVPVGVVSLAWSTRGEHARFFAELERMQARDHATERRVGGVNGPQESVRTLTIYPAWQTLRLGLAWR